MYKLYIACDISGDTFSPRKINLNFSQSIEVGEIAKKGRYKNQPNPYGRAVLSCEWRPGDPLDEGRNIPKSFIGKIRDNLQAFREEGATDIHLDVVIEYDSQCNFAFEPQELREISELNIPVHFSVYQGEVASEEKL